ncbi:MAG: 3D domain-containing protein [Verrucomicrobiota bacterium]
MNLQHLVFAGLLALLLSSCSTRTDLVAVPIKEPQEGMEQHCYVVKTTAYTHHEEDSQPYGIKTALGTDLQAEGEFRSAAADWSRYPVGTKFKIVGHSQVYKVDDYGSALVGTDTIDIYQPTMAAMRRWGAPFVGIEVLEWGSFLRSAEILEGRVNKAEHCREMFEQILEKVEMLPIEMHDGFPASEEEEELEERQRISQGDAPFADADTA